MIKKWSYVAAAMLTVASGVALTSCIDNDEPFGIREIRQATANLLDAKKAALEAESAAKNAQVEIAKIEAEIKKLQVENEKILAEANARVKEAEAKYKEAEAEAKRLEAEGKKAIDEATAAELLAQADKVQAEADKFKAEAEKIRKEAEAAYQEKLQQIARAQQDAANAQRSADQAYVQAEYWFEKTKADNANTWNQTLWSQVEGAFSLYLKSIEKYNKANKDYQDALNSLAEIEADLVWVEAGKYEYQTQHWNAETETWEITTETREIEEAGFISPGYGKKQALIELVGKYQRTVARCENNITLLDQYKDQLAALQEKLKAEGEDFDSTNDWAELLAQYEQELEAAAEAVEQAKLESEVVKVDQADVFAKPDELRAEYNEFMQTPIAIEPFSIDPMPEVLSALSPQWAEPVVVVPEDVTYYLSYSGYNMPVYAYQRSFNKNIRNLKLAKLDENDILWTEARKAELERELNEGNGAYAKSKAYWENARDVYNQGGVPKKSLLPKEAEVEKAIADYNALASEAKTLQDAYENAKEVQTQKNGAVQTAQDSYNESGAIATYAKAWTTYQTALQTAQQDYRDALSANQKEWDLAMANVDLKIANLWHEYSADLIEYEKILLNPNATPAEVKAKETQKNLTKKAYDDYITPAFDKTDPNKQINGEYVDRSNADKALTAANDAAKVALHQAEYDATDVMLAAQKAFNDAGGYNLVEKDPAYVAIVNAMKEAEAADKVTEAAKKAVDKFFEENVQPVYEALTDAVSDQLTEMGGYSWANSSTIPTQTEVDLFIAGGDFVEASIPVMYLNEKQVYENAKMYVVDTSKTAFGLLGEDYDVNGQMTYDWDSDSAVLIENADTKTILSMVDEYIKKMIIAIRAQNDYWGYNDMVNDYYDAITQFEIASHYGDFGEFGSNQELIVNIAYADICIANKDNSAIDKWIEDMKVARDAMLDTYEQKMKEADDFNSEISLAEQAASDLTSTAAANIQKAQDLYDVYNSIVNEGSWPIASGDGNYYTMSLKAYVNQLKANALSATNTAITQCEQMITNTGNQIIAEAEELATAKEKLAFYQYQLEQYESDAYAKVENPYKFEVEYLKAVVDSLEEEMAFYKQHYEELQKEYESAKKTANYPD